MGMHHLSGFWPEYLSSCIPAVLQMRDHEVLHVSAGDRRTACWCSFHKLKWLCGFRGDVVAIRHQGFQPFGEGLPHCRMRHFQRLENVVLNVLVEGFAGDTLKNIA